MISEGLFALIEQDADIIGENWVKNVRENPTTTRLAELSEERLLRWAREALADLANWIAYETKKDETEENYRRFGGDRKGEGLSLAETVSAMHLLKRYLWLHVLSEGLIGTAHELYEALELNNRVVLFFDRAVYHIILGYTEVEA